MTSVGTQTPWSWVQDLKQSLKLRREQGADLCMKDVPLAEEFQPEDREEEGTGNDIDDQSKAPNDELSSFNRVSPSIDPDAAAPLPEIHVAKTDYESKEETSPENEAAKEQLKLPEIVNVTENETEAEIESQREINLPPLLEQLTTLDFPDSPASHSSEDEDEEKKESPEEDQEDGDSDSFLSEEHQTLRLSNLPLPNILQYIRESESLASDYFSLQNKKSVEARLPPVTTASDQVIVSSATENGGSCKQEEERAEAAGEENVAYPCDFCGKLLPQHSLLDAVNEERESAPQESFCCEEYKEFCVLVAACMRQMVHRLRHQTPKKISIKRRVPKSKSQFKKSAEERVLAMMRRRRKWEELQRKKSMKRHVKMKKHTTTIQFSLVSPDVMETGWVVRPHSSIQQQVLRQKKKKNQGKPRHKPVKELKEINPFQLETLERFREEALPPGDLEERTYGDGHKLSVLLPDRTGHYYYHSGNKAVVVFEPYAGILAYLVIEDSSDEFQLLAYLDELGRACCYNKDSSIRLFVEPSTALSFDQQGSFRRKWTWNDTISPTHFQPLTLALNKQFTLKWSNKDTFLLTFAASQQQHIKFVIKSKLKNDTLTLSETHTLIEAVETQLINTKGKISQLLHILQQSSRLQKLAELQSIYAPQKQVTIAGVRPQGRQTGVAHKRTKSTGALNPVLQPAHKLRPLMH